MGFVRKRDTRSSLKWTRMWTWSRKSWRWKAFECLRWNDGLHNLVAFIRAMCNKQGIHQIRSLYPYYNRMRVSVRHNRRSSTTLSSVTNLKRIYKYEKHLQGLFSAHCSLQMSLLAMFIRSCQGTLTQRSRL